MGEESVRKRLRTSQTGKSVRPDLSAAPARLINITDIVNPCTKQERNSKLKIKSDLDY